MKKTAILCLCAILLLCNLSACSDSSGEPVETPPPTVQKTPQALSPAELEELFEKVFDSDGDPQSQETEQIALELSALKELADAGTLPQDYETRYNRWREEKIAALEAEKLERLKKEYCGLLLENKELAAAWDNGWPYYADYVDFDGDGTPEVLTVVRTCAEENYATGESYEDEIFVRVYGRKEGKPELLYETNCYVGYSNGYVCLRQPAGSSIKYLEVDEHPDEGIHYMDGLRSFYELTDGEWQEVDHFRYGDVPMRDAEKLPTWDPKSEDTRYWEKLSGAAQIYLTEGEFNTESAKYGDSYKIMSTVMGDDNVYIEAGLSLPDLLSISVTVNDEPVELDTKPVFVNGVFLAPVRPILEAMGVTVYAMSKDEYANTYTGEWKEWLLNMTLSGPPEIVASTKRKTLTISNTFHDDNAYAYYGEYLMYCDEAGTIEPPSPRMVNQQMVGPVLAMVECFDGKMDWDAGTGTLSITGTVPKEERMSQEEIKTMVAFSLDDACAAVEAQGYQDCDMEHGYSYRHGEKTWSLVVVPKGVQYEVYFEEEPYRTNAAYVTVKGDGTVTRGDTYYESMY